MQKNAFLTFAKVTSALFMLLLHLTIGTKIFNERTTSIVLTSALTLVLLAWDLCTLHSLARCQKPRPPRNTETLLEKDNNLGQGVKFFELKKPNKIIKIGALVISLGTTAAIFGTMTYAIIQELSLPQSDLKHGSSAMVTKFVASTEIGSIPCTLATDEEAGPPGKIIQILFWSAVAKSLTSIVPSLMQTGTSILFGHAEVDYLHMKNPIYPGASQLQFSKDDRPNYEDIKNATAGTA